MPVWTANGTLERTSISRITSEREYIASFGSVLPICDIKAYRIPFQFSIGSSIYAQLLKPPGHLEVLTSDFSADLLLDAKLNRSLVARFGIGHTSHHFMDDAFEISGYKMSLNYVKDFYQLAMDYTIDGLKTHIYGGAFYLYHFLVPNNISGAWMLEIGEESNLYSLNENCAFYIAEDLKFRSEFNYGTTNNLQLGFKVIRGNHEGRIAFNYRTGFEERGQFYNRKNDFTSLSLYFDF